MATFVCVYLCSMSAYSQLQCVSVLSINESNSDALETGFINLFAQPEKDQKAYDEVHQNLVYQPKKSIFETTGLNEHSLSYFKDQNPSDGVEDVLTLINDLMAEDRDAMGAFKYIMKSSYEIQARIKPYELHKPLLTKIMNLSLKELKEAPESVLQSFFRIFNKFNLLPHHSFVAKFEKAFLFKLKTESSGKIIKQMLMEFSHLRWRSPLRHSPFFLREYRNYILENFKDFSLSLKLQILQAEAMANNPFLPSQFRELLEQIREDLSHDDRYHAVSLEQLNGMYRALLYLSARNQNSSLSKTLKIFKGDLIESAWRKFETDITRSETDESESKKRVRHYQRSERRMLKELKKISRGEVSIEFMNSDLGIYDPVDFFIHNQRIVVEIDGPQHSFRFIDLHADVIDGSFEPLRNIDRARSFIFRENGIKLLRHSPLRESFNFLIQRIRSEM